MQGKTIGIIVALAVLVGGGAIAASVIASSDDPLDTLALVPENAFLYLEGSSSLSAEQRAACDDLASSFPDLDDCSSLGGLVQDALDKDLAEEDMSFEEDIEPWLGSDFVMFMTSDNLAEMIRASQEPAEFDLASFQEEEELSPSQEANDTPLPEAALLVTVDDEEAARAFLDEVLKEEPALESRSYEGVDYHYSADGAWGVFGGHIVLGTDDGMRAVIDQLDAESSLQDNDRFADAMDAARPDRLGITYIDLQPPFEAALESVPPQFPRGVFQPFLDVAERPVTITAHLEEGLVAVEATSKTGELRSGEGGDQGGSDAVRRLPPSTWGAIGIDGVGETLEGVLELAGVSVPGGRGFLEGQFRRQTGLDLQQDVLSWMGPAGMFIGGESDRQLFGGLAIDTSDPATTARTILALERLAAEDNETEIITRSGFRGFSASVPGQKQVGIMAVDDERAVVALGPLKLLDELADGATLGDSEAFGAAQGSLGEGFEVNGYFDVDMIRTVIERSMPGDDMYEQEVRPYLEPLEHIVFGSKVEDEVSRDRFVIGVE